MKINFDTQTLEINPSGENYIAVLDGKKILVEIVRVDAAQGRMDLRFTELSESAPVRESVSKSVYVSSDMAKRWVTINGHTLMLTKTSGAKQGVRHDHAGD
ncbi:MAG: hypothetical protein IPJ46_13530 [Anaerolineales bacterium]|nr:hypothetical protein [Anaerolineales bacterium]